MNFHKNIRQIIILYILLLFIFIPAQIYSAVEDEYDTLPVYNLGEIVVIEADRDKLGINTHQVTSNTINLLGQQNTKEALHSVPGLFTSYGAKGEARLMLRGFQGREVLILVDGRPVNLPYYGEIDLNALPLSNISKVKIVKGPADALYGANTMGGLINMVSKRIKNGSTYQLKLSASENNFYNAKLNFGSSKNNLDYWISLGYSSSDGYSLSDDFEAVELEDGAIRDHSEYQTFNIDGKLNYQISQQALLSFATGFYSAERGLPTGTDWATYQEFPEWKRYYFDLSGEGLFNQNFLWRAKLYYDVAQNRLKRYRDDYFSDDNLRFNSYHDSYAVGSRFTLESKINSQLSNISGFSMRSDGIDRQSDRGQPWLFNDILTTSLFNQFEIRPVDIVNISSGVSYDLVDSDQSNISSNSFNPFITISASPTEQLALHFSASRSTRFPTLDHLYNEISGNPDLSPEEAIKTEFGYLINLAHGISFNQNYFYNDVTNLIDRKSRKDSFENLFAVTIKGVESGVQFEINNYFQGSIYHTYLKAYESDTDLRRYHVPRNKFDYALSLNTFSGFTISHTGQYVSNRVDSEQASMADYYLAHFKISYDFRQNLSFYLNIRNLLDKNFEEERYYPMPGRMIIFGIEVGT